MDRHGGWPTKIGVTVIVPLVIVVTFRSTICNLRWAGSVPGSAWALCRPQSWVMPTDGTQGELTHLPPSAFPERPLSSRPQGAKLLFDGRERRRNSMGAKRADHNASQLLVGGSQSPGLLARISGNLDRGWVMGAEHWHGWVRTRM
jgi:hypothetical protein